MKNRIIAALVGGIIIFLWQYLSWSAMGIHKGDMKYHAKQTEIMNPCLPTSQRTGFT